MAKNVLNVENNLFDKCTVGNRKNRLQSIVLVPRDCNVQLNSGLLKELLAELIKLVKTKCV